MSGDGRERTNQMLEQVLKVPVTGAARPGGCTRPAAIEMNRGSFDGH